MLPPMLWCRLISGIACLALTSIPIRAENVDLILRQALILDGTGQPGRVGDVAVKSGRIVEVGRVASAASREVNAAGLAVAPGFIDVHTHAEDIAELPLAENFLRMGVTTLVLGNCGSSEPDLSAFFRRLEAHKMSPNIASLIGHNTVRSQVMGGSFRRPPTAPELDAMKSLVDQGMRQGAVGLATGLIYLPGTFAGTDELIELARVAAAQDGIYVSHLRHEDLHLFEAVEELIAIARAAQVRAEISHLKLAGNSAWGQASRVLQSLERARREGLELTQDIYLYTASSTGISTLIPSAERAGGAEQFASLLADASAKARLIAAMKARLRERGQEDYAHVVIANFRPDPALNGRTVPEAARKVRGSAALDDQIELILEIERQGGAQAVFHSMSEADLVAFAKNPQTSFASDSGVRKFNDGVPHPRGYGNNARVLARYVRELKVMTLEEAVRRMTSLPAANFRLKDRGQIRPGAWADLVLFDPDTVQDRATFARPHQYATGFRLVLVNGEVVVENDAHLGARPGRVLRHSPGATTNRPRP